MLLILPGQLTTADRQTLYTLLNGLDLGAARRGVTLIAARRLIIVLVLGPPGCTPGIEIAIAVKVVERRLTERAVTTAGARGEHAVHTISIMTYLTAVTGQKSHWISAVRPRAIAGTKCLIGKRRAGIIRAVRISGADRIIRMVLSAVTTSPRIKASIFASAMFRLLLLLVFLGAIAHYRKRN